MLAQLNLYYIIPNNCFKIPKFTSSSTKHGVNNQPIVNLVDTVNWQVKVILNRQRPRFAHFNDKSCNKGKYFCEKTTPQIINS